MESNNIRFYAVTVDSDVLILAAWISASFQL